MDRRSIQRIIEEASKAEGIQNNAQAFEIVAAVQREFGPEDDYSSDLTYACESLYTRLQGISGLSLLDSFHLGQTLANDYGRPYQPGFNTVDGASGSVQFGRFSLYTRGEYQHAPSAAGYSPALVATIEYRSGPTCNEPGIGDDPGWTYHVDQCAANCGSESFLPDTESRDFVWQERPLACSDGRGRLYV